MMKKIVKMKLIDKWFFVIYNCYYKGEDYKNNIPAFTVTILFAFVFFSTTFLLYSLYNDFIKFIINNVAPTRSDTGSKHAGITTSNFLAALLFLVISSLMFIKNKRYIVIYETYRSNQALSSYHAKYLAFSLIILVILSPILFAFIRNYYFWRTWL
ncbi:hypothetical protein SAMN06269250_3789 [Spirosoma fluviale]|uniref:Uncharacterized protein n=1 Tax=Spirosoma fluviale TaxID=1597977 RepID=A0A286G952_9BACT|nr:hypothetical protein SAMN06269250_3789 [Spirosoma fluviale]